MSNSCEALNVLALLEDTEFDKNRYTKEQFAEIWEVFKVFDWHADMTIHVNNVAEAMRAIGLLPSTEYSKAIVNKYRSIKNGYLSLAEFLTLLSSHPCGMEGSEAELRGIFRSVLDRKGTGWLRYGELRYVLLRVGDTLTEEEVNKIFKIHPPDPDGNIRYPALIQTLLE